MALERSRQSPFPWIVGLCGVAVLACYAFAAYAFATYGDRLVDPGWASTYHQGGFYVASVFVSISVACFAVALLLGFARPELWVARLGFATFLVSALSFLVDTLEGVRPYFGARWEDAVLAAMAAPVPILFPLVCHFFVIFPSGARQGQLRRAFTAALYVIGCAFVVPTVMTYLSPARSGGEAVHLALDDASVFYGYFIVYRVFAVVSLVAGYVFMIRNYRDVTSPDERRRLRWVVYGTAACIIPYSLMHAVDFALVSLGGPGIVANGNFLALVQAVTALFILLPLTFAYTILKHHVFDVDLAARLGVRYILAKGVLEVLLALPIVIHVARILANPDMTVREVLFGSPVTLVLVVAIAISLTLRARLRVWIDRKYFRDAYDSERIMLKLAEEIKQHESMSDISLRVSTELDAALHPRRLMILYRGDDDSDLTVTYSRGERAPAGFRVSGDAELVRLLERDARAIATSESGEWLPDDELDLLREHGVALAVPLVGTDRRLCGLLLLSAKRSEEPYSGRDRALLESVAAQMAMVYENAQLKSRVALDHKIRVEVLGRMEAEGVNLVKECPVCGTCYDSSDEICENEGATLTLSLPIERTVEGKYRLERLVGKGGMGAVYEGTDLRLARRVAVKVLTGAMFGDRAALRRFEREAQASARLSHPNIVRIYDYGALGDAGAFLVLELLRGQTLRAALQGAVRMQPREAARVFAEVFAGVAAAHTAGIVHRDLKPENIMLAHGEKGATTVKLLDFGLAKLRRPAEQAAADGASSLTVPGTIMGTFGYMSPEQLSGDAVDERADLFSLGVMVYEALVGRKPYAARTWVDLIAETTIGNVRMPGEGSEVRRLEVVLRRCLAGNVRDRYRSVLDAWRDLEPAILACAPFGAVTKAAAGTDSEPTEISGTPRR